MKPEDAKRCNDCPLRAIEAAGRRCAGPLAVALRPYIIFPEHTRRPVGKEEQHKVCGVGAVDARGVRQRVIEFAAAQAVRLGRTYQDGDRQQRRRDCVQVEATLSGPLGVIVTALHYFDDIGVPPKEAERVSFVDVRGQRQDYALAKHPMAINYDSPR